MSSKALLDVDETIIRNNLLLTEKKHEDEEIDNLLNSFKKSEPPSVIFRPLPGICMKFKCGNGEKVFLNICHTTEIPQPDDLPEEKLLEFLYGDTKGEEPDWRIPMSIGHERFETDKSGAKCPTCDIAINTKFLEKCQANPVFMTFLMQIVISAIEEKHNRHVTIDSYVILKNRKVMGKLHDHRVKKRELDKPTAYKPLIEELSGSSEKTLVREIKDKSKPIGDSRYVILRKPKNGRAEELVAYYKLPSQHRIKDMRVDVCEDRIIVEAPRTDYLVDVFVPYTLDQDNVTAFMDPNLNVLRLNIPVM